MTSISEISFGPVPSRRLGRSLGVNNIPHKACSYSCVYCQLGRTRRMTITRSSYYGPENIFKVVRRRVEALEKADVPIDYIAFVPDGEPTLSLDLGEEISMIKGLGYPVAVITNSSLIWDPEVRRSLCEADWVSLKIDSAMEKVWKRVDRPHGKLSFDAIVEGILEFKDEFKGKLCTETMVVGGVNDGEPDSMRRAELLCEISPERAYIAYPIRPPAEHWVSPPSLERISCLMQGLVERGLASCLLTSPAIEDFSTVGDLREEILRIASVHPIREDSLVALLEKVGEKWDLIENMLDDEMIVQREFGGERFYIHYPSGMTDKE